MDSSTQHLDNYKQKLVDKLAQHIFEGLKRSNNDQDLYKKLEELSVTDSEKCDQVIKSVLSSIRRSVITDEHQQHQPNVHVVPIELKEEEEAKGKQNQIVVDVDHHVEQSGNKVKKERGPTATLSHCKPEESVINGNTFGNNCKTLEKNGGIQIRACAANEFGDTKRAITKDIYGSGGKIVASTKESPQTQFNVVAKNYGKYSSRQDGSSGFLRPSRFTSCPTSQRSTSLPRRTTLKDENLSAVRNNHNGNRSRFNSLPRPKQASNQERNVASNNLKRSGSASIMKEEEKDPWFKYYGRAIMIDAGSGIQSRQPRKVCLGSASEGQLKIGDRILSINHRDASKLTHSEAQNIFKRVGTNCTLQVARPGTSSYHEDYNNFTPSSPPAVSSPSTTYQNLSSSRVMDQQQPSPHYPRQGVPQPYRTTQLIFPGAKSIYYDNAIDNQNVNRIPLPFHKKQDTKLFMRNGSLNQNGMMDSISKPEAVIKQPFRTTPLILPGAKANLFQNQKPYSTSTHDLGDDKPFRTTPIKVPEPKTIVEVKKHMRENLTSTAPPLFDQDEEGGFIYQHPNAPPMSKTVEIGGVKKQVVTKQFNSPLNLYSDESIADAVVRDKNAGLVGPNHPGYVDERPHLPTPKDATFSRPHQSATFRLILESEMDKAKDQQGIVGKEFQNQQDQLRPSSSMSNKSTPPDPVLMDNSISQSASFKRVMQAVLAEPEYYDPSKQ